MPPPTYPPEHHVLRDLFLEMASGPPGEQRGELGRAPTTAALLVALDVLAGSLCGRTVAPDWMATSSLQVHLWGPVQHGTELAARVLRAGRTTVVVEVDVAGPAGGVGAGVVTFARLPRRGSNLTIEADGSTPALGAIEPGPVPGDAVEDELGQVVLDPTAGRTSTELTPYVRNSFGAMNGGLVAAVAANAAGAMAGGPPAIDVAAPRHLHVDFLGQATVGPLVSTGGWLGGDSSGLIRVELLDEGRAEPGGPPRRCAVAHVVTGPR